MGSVKEFKQVSVMCYILFRIGLNLGKLKSGELDKGFPNTSSANTLHIKKAEVIRRWKGEYEF